MVKIWKQPTEVVSAPNLKLLCGGKCDGELADLKKKSGRDLETNPPVSHHISKSSELIVSKSSELIGKCDGKPQIWIVLPRS